MMFVRRAVCEGLAVWGQQTTLTAWDAPRIRNTASARDSTRTSSELESGRRVKRQLDATDVSRPAVGKLIARTYV